MPPLRAVGKPFGSRQVAVYYRVVTHPAAVSPRCCTCPQCSTNVKGREAVKQSSCWAQGASQHTRQLQEIPLSTHFLQVKAFESCSSSLYRHSRNRAQASDHERRWRKTPPDVKWFCQDKGRTTHSATTTVADRLGREQPALRESSQQLGSEGKQQLPHPNPPESTVNSSAQHLLSLLKLPMAPA